MLDFILFGTLWTFAIYGFIEVLKTIYMTFIHDRINADGIYLVIAAKNQEEKIEGVLRSILFRCIYGKEENINDIIVTDLGSTDKTREIMKKLVEDYSETIQMLNWNECKEVIENLEQK